PGGFVLAEVPDLVVYLHGFRSSPSSVKAQKVCADFESAGLSARLWVPQLSASPAEVMSELTREIDKRLDSHSGMSLGLIGSSLGGYYATVLAERYAQSRVLLLNPAVQPYNDLHDQTGRQKVYFSNEEIEFLPAYLSDLKDMEPVELVNLSRYCVVGATGDEVLDFDQMMARYPQAHQVRIEGSDHALSEFDQIWPIARTFMGLK
ncbi:MAG: YqiA/YcfP family alpha/beta fold hydrolase, partial [Limnobacter sp.]|nr:YqiA/YcfP family alpha/beta fold hydrolase [Limnobacter sp.]